MALPRLRVYNGPPADDVSFLQPTLPIRQMVTLPLGEVLPILTDAVKQRRVWLDDFETDEISISADLYELLQAYQQFRKPSA